MSFGPHLLDEVAFAGDEHLDPEGPERFDKRQAYDAEEDVALLRKLGLGSQSLVVDLGAGSGRFAVAVAPHCERVIAVDISPAMQAAMARRVAELGLENVVAVQQGLVGYEHQGRPADFVFSRMVLHHLPDFWKAIALQRIAEMLRPGGVFRLRDMVFDFDPGDAERVLGPIVDWDEQQGEAGWRMTKTLLAEEHPTFTWLLEPMLVRAGFRIEAADRTRPLMADYVCVAGGPRRGRQLRRDARTAIRARLRPVRRLARRLLRRR